MSCEEEKVGHLDRELHLLTGSFENGSLAKVCQDIAQEKKSVYLSTQEIKDSFLSNPDANPCVLMYFGEFCNSWITTDENGTSLSPELLRIILPEGPGVIIDHPDFTFSEVFEYHEPTNEEIEVFRDFLEKTSENKIVLKVVPSYCHLGLSLVGKKPYCTDKEKYYLHPHLHQRFKESVKLDSRVNGITLSAWSESAYLQRRTGFTIRDMPLKNFIPVGGGADFNDEELLKSLPIVIRIVKSGYELITREKRIRVLNRE